MQARSPSMTRGNVYQSAICVNCSSGPFLAASPRRREEPPGSNQFGRCRMFIGDPFSEIIELRFASGTFAIDGSLF